MNMKRWAALCALFIVLIIILADVGRLGFLSRIYDFPYGDKAGHFLLYGLLSGLVNLAAFEIWPGRDRRGIAIAACLLLAALIGAEELSQRWIHTRTSSWLDLTASYLGVAVFAWLAMQIARRTPTRRVSAGAADPYRRGT